MKTNLQGKTALVCGATKGIGRAIAHNLAEEGVKIIALARNEDDLKKLIRDLPGSGHSLLSLDLNQHNEIKLQISKLAQTGTIDILINNSAGPKPGPVHEAQIEELTNAFGQHILSAQTLAQCLLPAMKRQKFGRIINIVSTSVKCPIPGLGVSNTIRGAMASWSKTLAYELAKDGITVNCILPGYTKTERLQSLIEHKAKANNRSVNEEEDVWKQEVPAGRFADPKEIANLATFLASDLASYLTGTAIAMDGGKTPNL